MRTILCTGLLAFLCGCSSTVERSAPGAIFNVLYAAFGDGGTGGVPTDWKHQVTVQGQVVSRVDCPLTTAKWVVDMTGPLPADQRVCTQALDENGRFKFHCLASVGEYRVQLRDSLRGVEHASQTINAKTNDRFDLTFDPCPVQIQTASHY